MKKKIIIGILILVIVVFAKYFKKQVVPSEPPNAWSSVHQKADIKIKSDLTVTPKGNRLLNIDISPSEELDEVDAFSFVRSRVGIDAALAGGSWPEVETAPGKFNYPELKRANSIYKDVKIMLELNPIESFIRTVPSDMETVPFDDPVMIARFKKLLDVVFSQLPDLQITALWIGNEVTGYLDKSGEWDAYQTFYETVGAYAKNIRPGIKVGSAGSMDDWNNIAKSKFKQAKTLNQTSDIIVFTCYPTPGNVKNAFDTLTSEFAGRPIYIKEIGCTSSSRIGSSEETQAEFVKEVFRAWDEHASQIEYLSFHPLHDFSKELVTGLLELFGKSEDEDALLNMEIMTSFGLRTYSGKGKDKLAFRALIQEARARGWGAAARDLPLLALGNHLTIQRAEEFKYSAAVEAQLNAKWNAAVAKGMDIAMVGLDWAALEPELGVYDKANLEEPLKACQAKGLQPALLLTTLDSEGYYALPGEFVDPSNDDKLAKGMNIDDPRIVARFKALLDWVVPMLLKYNGFLLSVANEPESLFGGKPEEQQQFVNFLIAAREHTRTMTKDLPVTATLTRAVLTGDLDNVIAECDVACFNYYGQGDNFEPESPSMVSQRIDQLLAVAKGRQLLLQEVGMPSGYEDKPSSINSTPQIQCEFLENLFAKLKSEPRFRGACVFLMPDMPEEFCAALEQLYLDEGLPKSLTTRIRESFETVGLCHNTDGSAKPAWNTFLAGLDLIYASKQKAD
ncbi:MAG: hypothetical protein ACYS0I_06640 [Planctomycetota bacterium]|jgi:hypothetical protein